MATTRNSIPIAWERRGACIVCTSHKATKKGYIPILRNGRRTRLSRLVCERRHGRNDGLQVQHSCDNPSCINPDHLSFGTPKKNSEDAVSRNRMARGERQWLSKLTEDKVRAIRKATGTQREIAAKFGVQQMTISHILSRKTWKHVV